MAALLSVVLLGQVISALRDTDLLDTTVLLFTSDHGDLAMEHRQFYKMSMFEGSSHVPLLIMGPGVKSGLRLSQPVSLVDIYPTVLGKYRSISGSEAQSSMMEGFKGLLHILVSKLVPFHIHVCRDGRRSSAR